jgi:hypothetical protein
MNIGSLGSGENGGGGNWVSEGREGRGGNVALITRYIIRPYLVKKLLFADRHYDGNSNSLGYIHWVFRMVSTESYTDLTRWTLSGLLTSL